MDIEKAVHLQRLVVLEARAQRNFECALRARDFPRANHFGRRLATLDRTISDMSLEAIHLEACSEPGHHAASPAVLEGF